MSFIYRLLKQVTIIAQYTLTASAIILPNGIADIANVVHTRVHMAATSVSANASEELADDPYLAAKAVIVMRIVSATVTTPNIPVITTTRQRVATGAANSNGRTPTRLSGTFCYFHSLLYIHCMYNVYSTNLATNQ